ncbi:MAG TPA: hypothetical protein VJU81_24980 [Methylomirabilota bacterium]|nr:hypothetical protein [Methylomirabilota bacterium]
MRESTAEALMIFAVSFLIFTSVLTVVMKADPARQASPATGAAAITGITVR